MDTEYQAHDVASRKATTGASNGNVGQNSRDPQDPSGTYVNIDEMKDVTYGDIVSMEPRPNDTPEINNSNQERPNVIYSELI